MSILFALSIGVVCGVVGALVGSACLGELGVLIFTPAFAIGGVICILYYELRKELKNDLKKEIDRLEKALAAKEARNP